MIENLTCEFLATIGYRVFAYIPFHEHLRIPKKLLPLWLLGVEVVNLSAFGLLLRLGIPYAAANMVSIPISVLFFFAAVAMDWGKVLFVYVFTFAYILMGRGMAGVAMKLLPGIPGEGSWQYGLVTLGVFLLTCPFMVRYITQTAQMVFETHAPRVWKTIWLLPLMTLVIVMVFTYGKQEDLVSLFTRILLMLCLLFAYYYVLEAVQSFQKHVEATERVRHLEQISAMQESQYAMMQERMESARRARHDLRQHLTAIQGCIDSGDMEALAAYVKDYGKELPPETVHSFCKNYAVDAVLRHYAERAAAVGVDIEVSFQMSSKPVIPEPALCVLLGNLLENALDTCTQEQGERFIRVSALQTGDSMLSITVDNACSQAPAWENGRLRSTKHEGNETGTVSVRMIAERYNGDARFEWKDGVFYASVMLNP